MNEKQKLNKKQPLLHVPQTPPVGAGVDGLVVGAGVDDEDVGEGVEGVGDDVGADVDGTGDDVGVVPKYF